MGIVNDRNIYHGEDSYDYLSYYADRERWGLTTLPNNDDPNWLPGIFSGKDKNKGLFAHFGQENRRSLNISN